MAGQSWILLQNPKKNTNKHNPAILNLEDGYIEIMRSPCELYTFDQ